MKNRISPRFLELEDRVTPAVFGTAWQDGANLTISFAPDGTSISGTASDLFAKLPVKSRLDILRAFQDWAVHANLNFGLVADNGATFGTGAAPQGDSRFGDIRIGGRSLGADILAATAPYGFADPNSGDVVLNTRHSFGKFWDAYTVMLQEAGHALGVGNSDTAKSVMYEYYLGLRSGLASMDIEAVKALYGARLPDAFEGAAGNDTIGRATAYSEPIKADITTNADRDVYRVDIGLLVRRLDIHLKASGISLLTSKVELLDSSGQVVQSAIALDPTSNDLAITLSNPSAGATYYVRVSSTGGNSFGIGSYSLSISQTSALNTVTGLVAGLVADVGNTVNSALTLVSNTVSVGPRVEYSHASTFNSASDVDVYRITVPTNAAGGTFHLVASVWAGKGMALNPWIDVLDSSGRKLNVQLLDADGTTNILQLRDLQPGGTYYLRVKSITGAKGDYTLAADLRNEAVPVQHGGSGTLSAADTKDASDFSISQSGRVQIALSANGTGTVAVTVKDARGVTVGRFEATGGYGASMDIFLDAGDYRLEIEAVNPAPSKNLAYSFTAKVLDDPVGGRPSDTTTKPQPVEGGGQKVGSGPNESRENDLTFKPPRGEEQAGWF